MLNYWFDFLIGIAIGCAMAMPIVKLLVYLIP